MALSTCALSTSVGIGLGWRVSQVLGKSMVGLICMEDLSFSHSFTGVDYVKRTIQEHARNEAAPALASFEWVY